MGLVFHHGYSRVGGEILIKWTVLLTHLWQATVLPAGSYDDDDILTESPWGHPQPHRFARLGAGDFCYGALSGEI